MRTPQNTRTLQEYPTFSRPLISCDKLNHKFARKRDQTTREAVLKATAVRSPEWCMLPLITITMIANWPARLLVLCFIYTILQWGDKVHRGWTKSAGGGQSPWGWTKFREGEQSQGEGGQSGDIWPRLPIPHYHWVLHPEGTSHNNANFWHGPRVTVGRESVGSYMRLQENGGNSLRGCDLLSTTREQHPH